MKKLLKWIGIILGSLIGLLLVVMLGLYFKTKSQLNKTYDVEVQEVVIPTDAESIEHGRHLTEVLCAECHGDDLSGIPDFVSVPNIASISTPNITPGKGSVTENFSVVDWVRVLRHGVKPDGHSVFLMPSETFQYLNEEDLGDILAYMKTAPPIDTSDRATTTTDFTFLGHVVYGAGAFGNLVIASKIEHDALPSSFPEPGVTVQYGEYLVNINGCNSCHGTQFAGAKPPDPESILAPNLTPAGDIGNWTEAEFIEAFRTGIVPSGRRLIPNFMPWTYKGKMTDDELKAIFLFLQSLPALPTSTDPVE